MKRIARNRCGYDGYKCRPIPKLNPLFHSTYTDIYAVKNIKTTVMGAFDSAWVGPSSYDSSMLVGTIDNYAQLPQQFEGFIMTLAPIINMGTDVTPEVPELACRVDFNPFTYGSSAIENNDPAYTANRATAETGFLDYYTQLEPYSSAVYVDVEGVTAAVDGGTAVAVDGSTAEVQGTTYTLATDMPAYIQGSTITKDSHLGWIIGGDKITLTAGPGLLEPMLDTELPPIGIDTIPSADIIGDFAMWEFNTINQWQRLVDDRLNGLKTVIPTVDYSGINGLLNLTDQKNWKSPCSNFRIEITTGDHALVDSAVYDIPSYDVSDGTVLIKDDSREDWVTQTITCQGLSNTLVPAAFYLDVYWDTWTDPDTERTSSGYQGYVLPVAEPNDLIRVEGHTYVYIGRVKRSFNDRTSKFGDGHKYILFEPEQGECIDYLDLTSGGSSVVITGEYKGPFKLVVTGSTVYLSSGTVITSDVISALSSNGVIGGVIPEFGSTVSQDYIANTVKVYDGASSIPCDAGSTCYAGYYIVSGSSYNKVNEHIFNVAANNAATAYVILTKTDSSWSYEFVEEPGRAEPALSSGEEVPVQYAVPIGWVDDTQVHQIQYGDIFVDIQDIPTPSSSIIVSGEYQGPFKLSLGEASTYVSSGATVGSESVYGAPSPGTVATSDLKAYTLYISDGAGTMPTVTPSLAGYVVESGTKFVSMTVTSMTVDENATVMAYISGTSTSSGWAWTYDFESSKEVPNNDSVLIDGAFAYVTTLSSGSILTGSGGITYTVTGQGSGFVSYTYTKNGSSYSSTAKITNSTYLIPLGVVEGGTVGQVQYGHAYVDLQSTTSSSIVTSSAYNGPFKVEWNFNSEEPGSQTYNYVDITGIESQTNTSNTDAGYVYISGTTARAIAQVLSQEVATSAEFVYAHVGLTLSSGAYVITGCTFSDTYNAGSVPSGTSAPAREYVVRLAQLTSPDVTQIHYGDIYVDVDAIPDIPEPPDVEYYNGPFKVIADSASNVSGGVTISAFDGTTSSSYKLGHYVYNGTSAAVAEVSTNSHSFATAGTYDLYGHVVLSSGAVTSNEQTYSAGTFTVDTSDTMPAASGQKVYDYRLARVVVTSVASTGEDDVESSVWTTSVTQIQHGDLYLGDVNDPLPPPKADSNTYYGPFALTVAGVTCSVCPSSNGSQVYGYVNLNGIGGSADMAVTENNVTVGSTANAETPVWLVVSYLNNQYTAKLQNSAGASATDYSVWIGNIVQPASAGADIPRQRQVHYGNVYVNGRWM